MRATADKSVLLDRFGCCSDERREMRTEIGGRVHGLALPGLDGFLLYLIAQVEK